jgi:nucleotidyltransferase-like protein
MIMAVQGPLIGCLEQPLQVAPATPVDQREDASVSSCVVVIASVSQVGPDLGDRSREVAGGAAEPDGKLLAWSVLPRQQVRRNIDHGNVADRCVYQLTRATHDVLGGLAARTAAELSVDGAVVELVEKPAQPRSDLAIMGVYFFTPAIHTAIAGTRPSGRNELEITDAVQWLVQHGEVVRGERFDGYWKDTGRIEDLLECNQRLLEATEGATLGAVDSGSSLSGPVELAPGSRVVRSHIVGPTMIGPGTLVEDSFIGPYTAVGEGCVVSQASVEYSILLDGASVRGVSGVHGSLIGRCAEVGRAPAAGRRHRLILGDHTRVEIAP